VSNCAGRTMMARGAIPIMQVGSILLTTVHVELRDAVAEAFQEDVLLAIEKTGVAGFIIDIERPRLVDTHVARVLVETGRMV
jgi:rsbT antagonist protein RsbS